MSEICNDIEEACKIILSAACDLQLQNDRYKSLFNLKCAMFKSVSEENDKLKRLLAKACESMDSIALKDETYNMLELQSEELKQWYEAHKAKGDKNE